MSELYINYQTSFIDTIKNVLSFYDNEKDDNTNIFKYENSLENQIIFFMRYNEPSIFINLIISVLFRLFFSDNREINFQGANSAVRYFAVNIFPITTIYKNIPYYTYPTTDYWTLIQMNTEGDWVNNVKFFSFTPYIGQYIKDGQPIDYLANCNTSITSTLMKADHPDIFTKKRDRIKILYTFNRFFANIFHHPEKKQYAVLLPNMIDSSTFTIMTRFEKIKSLNTINFSKSIRVNTFSEYPYFIQRLSDKTNVDLVSPEFLKKKLNHYPVLTSNYEKNKININQFLSIVQEYNKIYQPLKIYPYFYLSNQNKVVTNIYNLIDSNSDCNALINDFNKNYYNSEKIKIRDENGNLLYSTFIIIGLNHVLSEISTSNNIQVYNVENQKSIQTYETSTELPYLSDSSSPSSTYNVKQEKGIYRIEIDTSVDWLEGINEIAFFERVCYPIAFKDNREYINSGPRYSSFTIDTSFPNSNPSIDCLKKDVEKENVYTIKSNDPDYSLHLNYCTYSTLNFRVFYQ